MKVSDFQYDLPQELIAQYPASERCASALLRLNPDGSCQDLKFSDFPACLQAGDLLVVNDTRVIPARLIGRKATGGRVEVLIERLLDDGRLLVQIRSSKTLRSGQRLEIDGTIESEFLQVEGRDGTFYILSAHNIGDLPGWLSRVGHTPLPPYIHRDDTEIDADRYQTVYARNPGAVAAPTAGLHLDDKILVQIADMGVELGRLTLHVGAGTFQPVRSTAVEEHVMHAEHISVPEELCDAITNTRERGGRVVAVGTTVVRALESAAQGGELSPFEGDTRIFIYPGFRFRVVDALLTNFHLPGSTLIMLVSAFGGMDEVLDAYRHAVESGYRFFSYGDAMFLTLATVAADRLPS